MAAHHLSMQEISDRIQIQDLLARYALAVDTKDWSLLDSCFTPDAHVDYTATGGAKGSYVEMRGWLESALLPFAVVAHYLSNSSVTLNGETAHARTYLWNPMGFKRPDGELHWFNVGAHYVDELKRTSDGWRIKHRVQERGFIQGSLPGQPRRSSG